MRGSALERPVREDASATSQMRCHWGKSMCLELEELTCESIGSEMGDNRPSFPPFFLGDARGTFFLYVCLNCELCGYQFVFVNLIEQFCRFEGRKMREDGEEASAPSSTTTAVSASSASSGPSAAADVGGREAGRRIFFRRRLFRSSRHTAARSNPRERKTPIHLQANKRSPSHMNGGQGG